MNSAAASWLPETALGDQTLLRALDTGLAQWSAAWMPHAPALQADAFKRRVGPGPAGCLDLGPGLTLHCHIEDRLRLATLLLGMPVGERSLRTPADRQLVDGLVDDALAALGQIVAKAMPPPQLSLLAAAKAPPPLAGDSYVATIRAGDGEPLLALGATRTLLASLRCAAAPAPRPQGQPAPPLSALGGQQVSVSGLLGTGRLRLAEVESLAPGDVIVLDQPVDAPIPLLVEGRLLAREAAFVQSGGSRHFLVIEKAPSQC